MHDKGHRIAGRYRLVRALAQGGMGSVWVAEDAQLGREVAVKVMVPAAFALPDLVARFHREAKAAAHIKSSHVVQVFDHGIDGDQPYIVMELLDGEDLAARLRREPRLSLDATVELAIDVCKALKSAHDQGVVHRDLKPANIFLARQDDGEVVKVLDFGVAKLTGADAEKTQAHALLGTPHYMAPEQTHDTGTPVDLRADLWSLGVIAFRAITGELPFTGDNPVSVMMAVASRPAPAPSTMAPDLGLGFEVDRFFAIALARDRTARFQSAQAFREAITRLGSRSSVVDMRASRPSDPRFVPEGTQTVQIAAPAPAHAALPFAPTAKVADAPLPLSELRKTIPLRADTPKSWTGLPQATLAQSPTAEPSQRPSMPSGSPPTGAGPGAEPTPAVMSSTQAPQPKGRSGANLVVWLAAGGAILAAGIVVASVLTSGSEAEPSSSQAASPPTSGSVTMTPAAEESSGSSPSTGASTTSSAASPTTTSSTTTTSTVTTTSSPATSSTTTTSSVTTAPSTTTTSTTTSTTPVPKPTPPGPTIPRPPRPPKPGDSSPLVDLPPD